MVENDPARQNPIIGKNWITRLLDHHPVLPVASIDSICNPRIILDHFRKLGNIIRKGNIQPRAITNVDEKGFIMGYSKGTKVITSRGQKNPRDANREFLTAVEAVAADGYVFPSFLIEKGKKHHIGWYLKRTPQSTHQPIPVTPKRAGVRFRLSSRRYADDTSSTPSEISISSSHSRQPQHTPLPRIELRLNTVRNPNPRLPGCPLGMSLRTRTSRTMKEQQVGGWRGRGWYKRSKWFLSFVSN